MSSFQSADEAKTPLEKTSSHDEGLPTRQALLEALRTEKLSPWSPNLRKLYVFCVIAFLCSTMNGGYTTGQAQKGNYQLTLLQDMMGLSLDHFLPWIPSGSSLEFRRMVLRSVIFRQCTQSGQFVHCHSVDQPAISVAGNGAPSSVVLLSSLALSSRPQLTVCRNLLLADFFLASEST